MSKLYNLGCSFAYGNCAPRRNKLCNQHKGPGTYIAKYLDRKEVNLARNGNSIDGVLRRLYTYDTWDYNWRWYGWLYGTGETGNNATHELDIARWALNLEYPSSVNVYAGKYHYIDDGWTMYDTMEAKFKFPGGKTITWDGQSRNAFGKEKEGGRGTKIWGSNGSAFVNRNGYRIFNLAGEKIYDSDTDEKFSNLKRNMTEYHFENFFNSIRNGEKLTSPIDDAAVSQSMTHYANMAYRTGKSFEINSFDGSIKDNKVKKIWSREYEKGWQINKIN